MIQVWKRKMQRRQRVNFCHLCSKCNKIHVSENDNWYTDKFYKGGGAKVMVQHFLL